MAGTVGLGERVCYIPGDVENGEYEAVTSVTRSFNMFEYATASDATAAMLADTNAPLLHPVYNSLVRKDFQVTQITTASEKRYDGEVTYEQFTPKQIDNERFSGSITLVNQKVKTPAAHIDSYGPGAEPAMDAGGLVGVTSTGVEGVDIQVPVLTFTITRYVAPGTFNTTWLANANAYVGKPNSIPWRDFDDGEVMLTGVDGTEGDNLDEISFSFQASPTFANITIPSPLGNIVIPQKRGFQYVWIQYVEKHDATTGFTSQVPHTAHLEELAEFTDINGLIT